MFVCTTTATAITPPITHGRLVKWRSWVRSCTVLRDVKQTEYPVTEGTQRVQPSDMDIISNQSWSDLMDMSEVQAADRCQLQAHIF